MTTTELKTFPLTNVSLWTYKTKLHHGTCVIDGEIIKMRFVVTLWVPEVVPDVLAVEEFCCTMAQEKNTLEGYTAQLAAFVGGQVTGKGKTQTHGVITCTTTVSTSLARQF